ncbi:hypothetical protein BN130_2230 [Cronobacter malonaticus 507]|nr:hypothetical protein BN130_2230 [Cronobacter malonaticus 507]
MATRGGYTAGRMKVHDFLVDVILRRVRVAYPPYTIKMMAFS